MTVLSYQTIREYCETLDLITPYGEKRKLHGLSGGLSENGYDIHVKQEIKLYPITLWNLLLNTIGIKRPSFALASTYEHFKMPNFLMANVADKSTLARQGLAVQNTILEAGWSGYLTIELNCQGNQAIHIRAGQPIAQVIFIQLDEPTVKSYKGKYQNQQDKPVKAILET